MGGFAKSKEGSGGIGVDVDVDTESKPTLIDGWLAAVGSSAAIPIIGSSSDGHGSSKTGGLWTKAEEVWKVRYLIMCLG